MQKSEWHFCAHRHLHDGHHFASLGADHGEAENAIVARVDQGFENPCVSSTVRVRSMAAVGIFAKRHRPALAPGFGFGQADVGDLRIDEQAGRHEPVARAAGFAGEVVADNAEIVH